MILIITNNFFLTPQGKQVSAGGENVVTSGPQCNYPEGQVTSLGQPTCYETCEPTQCGGECYTQAYTCSPTACSSTCAGTSTCEGTCQGTCQSTCPGWYTCDNTCQSTCKNTCNCPPLVYGYVYHHAWGMPWTNNWDEDLTDERYVFQYAPPYEIVGFDENGYYSTREFGQPRCALVAKGEI